MPPADFLAIIELIEAAARRNSDIRVKGFYLNILENLRTAFHENHVGDLREVN